MSRPSHRSRGVGRAPAATDPVDNTAYARHFRSTQSWDATGGYTTQHLRSRPRETPESAAFPPLVPGPISAAGRETKPRGMSRAGRSQRSHSTIPAVSTPARVLDKRYHWNHPKNRDHPSYCLHRQPPDPRMAISMEARHGYTRANLGGFMQNEQHTPRVTIGSRLKDRDYFAETVLEPPWQKTCRIIQSCQDDGNYPETRARNVFVGIDRDALIAKGYRWILGH